MIVDQSLITDIQAIIYNAKDKAIRLVDHERTLMYWHIGQRIFEEEQQGKDRADYGDYLIRFIAENLEPLYGSGFSKRQIELFRQFYRAFPIANTLYSQLSWSQYKLIIRIEDQDSMDFYIAETVKNNWTVRQLERQIYSNLWERLLMSNDRQNVLAVARNEREPSDAKEIIKDPIYLEFLRLKREASYYEKDFEQAIITHLQEFLLGLGNGFAFVARQKRLHIAGDEFFIDLVFYNRLLKCFVIVEIMNCERIAFAIANTLYSQLCVCLYKACNVLISRNYFETIDKNQSVKLTEKITTRGAWACKRLHWRCLSVQQYYQKLKAMNVFTQTHQTFPKTHHVAAGHKFQQVPFL